MLKVRTTMGLSPINGTGLFAAEPIAAGTKVWEFTPGLDLEMDPAILEAQPPIAREALLHYGYIDRRSGRFVLCCDNARFINHNNDPNFVTVRAGHSFGVDIAIRDIASGEEITINYAEFEEPPQPPSSPA